METPVIVAVIGGVVTVVGFVISGLFGVLASTSAREAAASLGVEKALNERLKGKDDHIAYQDDKIENLEAELAQERATSNDLRTELLKCQGIIK